MATAVTEINKSRGTTFSWLKTVPSSDVNFKSSLKEADAETIRAVLAELPEENSITKRKALEARLRQLEISPQPAEKFLRDDLQKRKAALEADGWEFDFDGDKKEWTGTKAGEMGGTGFNSLEKLLNFIEKRLENKANSLFHGKENEAALSQDLADRKSLLEAAGWNFNFDPETKSWGVQNDITGFEGFENVEKLIAHLEGMKEIEKNHAPDPSLVEKLTEAEKPENLTIEVEASRLDDTGDIAKSLSTLTISEKQTIKQPFDYNGEKYVGTSAASAGAGKGWARISAYKVVPEAEFEGEVFTYHSKPNGQGFDGVRVTLKKEPFILVGPRVSFIAKKEITDESKDSAPESEALELVKDQSPDILPKTVMQSCRMELTDNDVVMRSSSMMNALNERDQEIARFAAERDKHKSNLKMIDARIQKHRTAIDTRIEWREIECIQEFDFQRGIVNIIRPDTNEVVKQRSMTKEELQKTLFKK